MIEMRSLEERTAIRDWEIAQGAGHGYRLRSRTQTSAVLVRAKRYNWWIALVCGFLFYSIYVALFQRSPMISIEIDPQGRVVYKQGKARTQSRGQVIVGLILGVLCLLFVVMLVVLGARGLQQDKGVHVCTDANYSGGLRVCRADDHDVTMAAFPAARITQGTLDGATFSGTTLEITLSKQDASGTARFLGTATFTVHTTSRWAETLLANVFQEVNATPAPGTYLVQSTNSGGGAPIPLGSTTFVLAP